jgi:hypothetical protein
VVRQFFEGLVGGLVQGLAIGCVLVALVAWGLYVTFG